MRAGPLPRILAYAGSVSIERTWRDKGKDINRQVKMSDISNIGIALDDGWVITFPQGTTTPFKPIRKGTAHIIKEFKPVVIPIVIDGFRRSFDKKGIRIKKKGILQSMEIKQPLKIDYQNDSYRIPLFDRKRCMICQPFFWRHFLQQHTLGEGFHLNIQIVYRKLLQGHRSYVF